MSPEDYRLIAHFLEHKDLDSWVDWDEARAVLRMNDVELYSLIQLYQTRLAHAERLRLKIIELARERAENVDNE